MDAHSSKHHPNGGARLHLDSAQIEAAIATYQTNRDLDSLSAIVELTQDRALTLIRFRKTTKYVTEDELLSDINFRLLKAADKFDPAKGSAFTFVSRVVTNVLCTAVTVARRNANRRADLDEVATSKLVTNGELDHREITDDLIYRIKAGVRSTITDARELDAQRWYVTSFCQDGFGHQRHQCADAAMTVYSLSHERSRELYDLTMLEVRRLLYPDLPPRPTIISGALAGTREQWMIRYAHLMNANEFTKFVVLMKGLGPFVVYLVDPQNYSRRPDRCAAATRRNLEFILNGHPDAVRLFE